MIYVGPPIIKSNGSYQFKIHADEILILQSHTAIGTKSVFKGCLKPNGIKYIHKQSRFSTIL